MVWKALRIPFEWCIAHEERIRNDEDMPFWSSDALVILLRKLPERCKTRPSKLHCNSSFCPLVSKIGTQVTPATWFINPKMYRGLGNICKSYYQYGTVSLPNVTTNLYFFFQLFSKPYQWLSNTHSGCYTVYTPTTCIILTTKLCRWGELDLYTRELQLSSRSATRTYPHFSHSSSHHG